MSSDQAKLELSGGSATIPIQNLVDHAQDLIISAECQLECLSRTLRALHETVQAGTSAAGLKSNNRLAVMSGGTDKVIE